MTYMRPYLELEQRTAEVLGWTDVTIDGDLDFGDWSAAWHNQTVLHGRPPDMEHHGAWFAVPRYIVEGKALELLELEEIDINWYMSGPCASDSFERVPRALEDTAKHPTKRVALCVAICKLTIAIKTS